MKKKSGIEQKITELVDRACQDELFALEIKRIALAAGRNGVGTKEYRQAMELLASNEEELRVLTSPQDVELRKTTITTTTITATTSTFACTMTTTTSTTTTTTDIPIGDVEEIDEKS